MFSAMCRGEIPDTMKELMQDHLRLGNVDQLDSDKCFGKNFRPGGREVHVLVELPSATQQVTMAGPTTARTESRLKRWRDLNGNYNKSKKARTNNDWEDSDSESNDASGDATSATSCSSVRWCDIQEVYKYLDKSFTQTRKPVPDDAIDDLVTHMATVSKTTKGYLDMSVGVQRQLIGPVLIMLCNLFDGMKPDFDRTVTGNQIHAQIQLDFVFKRGKKTTVCVAHAKRSDFNHAIARALAGCEAIAEREDQHVVYGIVTDFLTWYLFRCGENSVAMDWRTLAIWSHEVHKRSLRDVCEMIYGALADHDEEDKKDEQLAMG